MKLEVYNIKGKEIGRKIDLDKSIFQIDPNHHAIYLDLKQHLANKRQGTNSTKHRSFIKGSTKKIKKQKNSKIIENYQKFMKFSNPKRDSSFEFLFYSPKNMFSRGNITKECPHKKFLNFGNFLKILLSSQIFRFLQLRLAFFIGRRAELQGND